MAHASFVIIDLVRSTVVDGSGNQKVRVRFTAYFTSGRHKSYELDASISVENPVGTPRTANAIKLLVFAAVRAEVNRLDALDAAPAPVDIAGPTTRFDATLGTPTAIADADIPADDPTAPRV